MPAVLPGRQIGLCHYTVIEVPPPDFVEMASGVGFDAVSLMIEFPAGGRSSVAWMNAGGDYPMHGDTAMLRETKRRLDDTGVLLVDASTCRLEPDTDVEDFRPMLESAAYLGARQVNTNGNDPDRSRLADRFAALARMAAEYQLPLGIEFQMMTHVRTLGDALGLIAASGAPNAAVTVDAVHLARSGGHPADVAGLERSQISYAQLCDGPADVDADRYAWEAGVQRLLPGQGTLPLRALVDALPPDVVLGAEVPSKSRHDQGITSEVYAASVRDSIVSVAGGA